MKTQRSSAKGKGGTRPLAKPVRGADLTDTVGRNVNRLRVQAGLSLDGLSRASGVSRSMLGQIELGQSAPTINVLWKIARALAVPFSALIEDSEGSGTRVLRQRRSRRLTSHDGTFVSRALFSVGGAGKVECYELRLAKRATEQAEAHAPGTREHLVISEGRIEIQVGSERHLLETGDGIVFEADLPHAYVNPGEVEAVMFLVMAYASTAP